MSQEAAETNLVILAGGGHATEVYSYVTELTSLRLPIKVLGIIDENKLIGVWEDSRVIGDFDAFSRLLIESCDARLSYITAVGNNRLRQHLVSKAEQAAAGRPLFAWTLRHPTAGVGRRVEIGEGTLLAPGSLITTRSRIGRHCILNVKASVSHDCTVGDYVNLNPGATVCGNVGIGEGAFIGAGATVINGVSVGAWSTIGAGAVVVRDIPPNVTAVGVPARVIKQNKPHQL